MADNSHHMENLIKSGKLMGKVVVHCLWPLNIESNMVFYSNFVFAFSTPKCSDWYFTTIENKLRLGTTWHQSSLTVKYG